MAKEIAVTVSMPARLYSRLQCRAANAGLSVERAILHCVEQNTVLVDAPEAKPSVVTQPGQLWADKWSSRWGELGAAREPRADERVTTTD